MTDTIGGRIRQLLSDQLGNAATQSDLAEAVNMPPDALSRALNGQRQFATIELVRIANYLHASMHWIATGEPDPAATRVAARHTFDSLTRRHDPVNWTSERTAIQTVATAYAQAFRDREIEPAGHIPASARDARDVLSAHNENFVRTFAEAVESTFRVDVVRIPEASRPYSIEVLGRRVIVVPPHVNWFYQNWSIAHELGHFASGNLEPIEEEPVATGAAERAANAYAAELLLPEVVMHSTNWSEQTPPELAENLWRWGVSTDAVKRRLASLQIVPSDELREVLNMTTQQALRRHWVEPDSSMWVDAVTDRMERANTRRFPAELLRAHMEKVAAGRLRSTFLAWMLGTDPESLESDLSPIDSGPDLDELLSELGLNLPPAT